ncbi:outer membrane protein OmpA-like peptidoglycan-associated protein [Azospirillum agricola]|uniref:OmpA family protein n=1 Tax=Azospirillum agricola TaxID=1720247 RepID=UPI001AE69976|nr:OmpA family protein [Azospirillum agricola]MBP2228968.1 outer membrane protein OmpA-like peptidoglycan-associated protein [Azospirillum agricola]
MSTHIRRALARLVLPALAIACAGPALAQTMEGSGSSSVLMFDRPPTVDELREVVAPKPRTRSIEIMGGVANSAAQRQRPTEQANYPSDAASAPEPAPAKAVPPKAQPRPVAKAQPQPEPPIDRQAAPPDARQQAALPEPPPPPEPAAPNAFGFRINFAFNSAEIPREFQPYIDAVGGLMAQDSSLVLVVEGHTDAVGSAAYNQTLSQRRAVAVGEYLVRMHHIDPQRIAVAGKGPAEPVMPDPYDGRNRRVEFKPAR